MSELLTTGQLMDLVRYLDNTAEYLAGSDGIAAADILKHDAALRQQLTTLQAHVQEQQVEYAKNADTIQHVKQQLAAVTKEREEARDMAACLLFFGPTFPADVAWAEMQIAKMKHEKGLP